MIAQAARGSAGGDDLAELLAFVSRHAGLVFPADRLATVAGGVRRAMRRVGVSDPAGMLARARGDHEAFDELMAELTVGETYFFREGGQFEFIRERVVPELLDRAPGPRGIRAWSAACASGEETYSLAITVRDAARGNPVHVVGTDVSRHRLRTAQRAVYKDWSLRGVGPDRVARHFTDQGKLHRLNDADRRNVDFRYLNLAEDAFPSIASGIWGMDVVMCRNVLIYFDEGTIRRVAARLLDALSDDGWLFLGASDPVISDFLPCDVELTGAGVAYRRRGARGGRAAETPPPAIATLPPPAPPEIAGPPEIVAEIAPPARAPEEDASADLARAYALHDYARAAELARAATAAPNAGPGPWTLLVRSLANEGRLPEAGAACAAGLDRYGTSAELMYLHGVLLEQAGRWREAADAARRALYLDRDLIVAHLLLGGALARLGDRKAAGRALAAADRALAALDPATLVRASDGEPAGRLREMARVQLALLPATES